MTSDRIILEARGIGRRLNGSDRWLLRNVSLQVFAGERLILVGPSGSGKSVLLRMLAQLDPTDEGGVLWHGDPVDGESIPEFRSRVIYLHQRPALVDGSVEANLRYPFTFGVHRHRRFDLDRIVHWLNLLGREKDFLAKTSRDLSGGEAQITALLRAIQLEPELLLLDEPTAALDHATTEAVERSICQWQAEAAGTRSVVLVSHDQQQAGRMGERIVSMDAGKLTFESRDDVIH